MRVERDYTTKRAERRWHRNGTLIPIFSGQLIPISRPTPINAGRKVFSAPAESALDFLRAGPKPRKRLGFRAIPRQGARLRRREVRILRPVNTERAEMRPPAGSHLHASTRPTPQSIDSATRHGIFATKNTKTAENFYGLCVRILCERCVEKGYGMF